MAAIKSFTGKHQWLSNFYKSFIEWDGITYSTAEHSYQALKTNDEKIRLEISDLSTPGKAKRFGKTILLEEGWEDVKVGLMEAILRKKFPSDSKNDNYHLTQKLISTGGEELVEGNDWDDTFWGVCNGVGENMLGKLLMKIRKERSKYV